jgi:alpha-beta hydrolase superfamily lysophospholipase
MKTRKLMTRAVSGTLRHTVRALLYGVVGAVIVLLVVFVRYLDGRPDLEVWHTAELDAEFTADSPIHSFEDYLALEERLFAQLDERVYDEVEPSKRHTIDRYSRGSTADPSRWPRNWNRSFELPAASPRAGVLLVHGMSDSPYSMRALAQHLHEAGAWTVGLRVPGHGTAPVGLVHVEWEDMAAAVVLAMRHLQAKVADRPLYVVGYSNGGALTVHYALAALEDDSLPAARGLVLLSPEIGITKLAALAVWQERLGHLLGMRKLAWNSILPEYDPFKYGSFALNAGKQAHLLTREIQSRISRLGPAGSLERFPPLLAFQSVVDATVTASALVQGLFQRLPPGGHELVLFDINRFAGVEPVLKTDPTAWIDEVLRDRAFDFSVTLVTNESAASQKVVARHLEPGASEAMVSPLGLIWPRYVYSLSHVALPFRPDDPLYGGSDAGKSPGISLGNVALRGERGALRIGAADLLRLRWNPFHSYMERRVLEFVR